jgi:hypothetical protein
MAEEVGRQQNLPGPPVEPAKIQPIDRKLDCSRFEAGYLATGNEHVALSHPRYKTGDLRIALVRQVCHHIAHLPYSLAARTE